MYTIYISYAVESYHVQYFIGILCDSMLYKLLIDDTLVDMFFVQRVLQTHACIEEHGVIGLWSGQAVKQRRGLATRLEFFDVRTSNSIHLRIQQANSSDNNLPRNQAILWQTKSYGLFKLLKLCLGTHVSILTAE